MSNCDNDDGPSGPSMQELLAPVSARKRRPSRKLVRTLGQRREGAIFYRPNCSWCEKPKARETDDSCTQCAAELERLAKRAKVKTAPLLAYFAPVAEVVRKRWFPNVNASALATFYIKQGGLCAITGNPMTIDPTDPAAA